MAGPAPEHVVTPMSALADLAHAYGVATSYWTQSGERVEVSPATIVAVLRALGADPTDDTTIAESLRERALRDWRRMLPPVHVTVEGIGGSTWVHVPHGAAVHAWIECEDGRRRTLEQLDRWVEPRDVDGTLVGQATFAIPPDLPLGWHDLVAEGGSASARCPLVVTPQHLPVPSPGRMWGLMTQLYSLRSQRSWGLGDLADLADLCSWSGGDLGADFALVNPLHAPVLLEPITPSPYLPATRRFPSPLYLRIEEIPEVAYLGGRDRKAIRRIGRSVASVDAGLLDRDACWRAKAAALDIVHTVPLTPGRQAAFDAFIAREGRGLLDVATWFAIADTHGARWQEWPETLRHPRSAGVDRWRSEHPDRIDYHLWLQWLLDEQLAGAAAAARNAGMRIGVVHDLAVGVGFDGADAWALQDTLARGIAVGAPPDMYNQRGQDWAQPPWQPDALADAAFIPFRDMLRSLLRHAGGIRIDHILGLFRMWWIPEGNEPHDGTYVAFDHDSLLGILALEAHRAGAVVIGEDLGTVEPWVHDALAGRGLLGTTISWFERDDAGAILAPEHWRRDALASVTVHDLPPTAGYLEGEHVRIRAELGLLGRPEAEELAAAAAERAEWLALLDERGLPHSTTGETVVSLHRMLAASPARLLGVALPDLVGQRLPQNQPGTDREYPNWCVPLADADGVPVALDALPAFVAGDPVAAGIVRAVAGGEGRTPDGG